MGIADTGDERSSVDLILPKGVVLLVCQPGAAAAPHNIRADDAAVRLQGTREVVEIATVARQSVSAQDHMRIRGVAPIGVRDLMEPVRVEAGEGAFDHSSHRAPLRPSAAV
jgi:hypothetical protein